MFVMASFDIAALSRLGCCQKCNLCEIAAHYGISVSLGLRKNGLWDIVIAGLISIDALPLEQRPLVKRLQWAE